MDRLDPEICYRALRTRDARFDGRFFTAVRTTGVFCRPICPAPTPRPENCEFVPCAATARERGFRPCLRCRPEASPGTPAWHGTSATVSRALRLIGEGALDGGGVDALATRLGVGERHLRRLFERHLGASPIAVAQTRRVLFAKKLLDETRLPIAEVARASGFSSVRRFNDAVQRTYRRPPRALRRDGGRARNGAAASDLVLKLPFRPPLAWDALAGFLAARAIPGVESVTGRCYRRSVEIEGIRGAVEVEPAPGEHSLHARIRLSSPSPLIRVAERLRSLFDLCADPAEISARLRSDALLRGAVDALPGLRVPGAWDGFELAVRAILGQQVSVKGATTLAGRLATRYGEPLELEGAPEGVHRLFPRADRLARADLTTIGLPRARAAAVRALARAVERGALVLDGSGSLEAGVESLASLPGVGEWTAHYVAMRALREPDAFPASDLGLRRALARGASAPTPKEILRRAEAWRPWRAYAAMYLWTAAPSPRAKQETAT